MVDRFLLERVKLERPLPRHFWYKFSEVRDVPVDIDHVSPLTPTVLVTPGEERSVGCQSREFNRQQSIQLLFAFVLRLCHLVSRRFVRSGFVTRLLRLRFFFENILNILRLLSILSCLLRDFQPSAETRRDLQQAALGSKVDNASELVRLARINAVLSEKLVFIRGSRLHGIQATRGKRVEARSATHKIRAVSRFAEQRR